MPKSKRIPDGDLKAASRDIRTVLRWAANVEEMRSIRTTAAKFVLDSGDVLAFELEIENEDGECLVRGKTTASAFREVARMIREKEIDDYCYSNDVVIEGRDF